MMPLFGQLCLYVAIFFASILSVVPLVGYYRQQTYWMATARPAALGLAISVGLSFLSLMALFAFKNFHVVYVATNAAENLPLLYRLAATWGAHEGSLLLWLCLLCLWVVAICVCHRQGDFSVLVTTLPVLGWIALGFLLLLVLTANPFLVSSQVLPGRDLNPLLQDPGLVSHPPMLYMGYVGFAVVFAFTVGGLIRGQIDATWAQLVRPWLMLAWTCLTVGITLGSWWAYRELGWGGYWFWDPVENAALMPWLLGTALIHAMLLLQKRGTGANPCVMLAIFGFMLSLLGTFLVRSGVIVSVHAFAQDPTRGIALLLMIGFIGLLAFIYYARRARHLVSEDHSGLLSREMAIRFHILLFLIALITVLLGTIYPMLLQAFGSQSISVGPPFYEALFKPLGSLILLLMVVGVMLRWQQDALGRIVPRVMLLLACSVIIAVCLLWGFAPWFDIQIAWAVFLLVGVAGSLGVVMWQTPWRQWSWPLLFGHLGLVVMLTGIVCNHVYADRKMVQMTVGDTVMIAGHQLQLTDTYGLVGPNYKGIGATFTRLSGMAKLGEILPEKRVYLVNRTVMTDAGIDAGVFRDIYIALGQPVDENTWGVTIYYKPFVRWIWVGGLIMAAAGLLRLVRRRRV